MYPLARKITTQYLYGTEQVPAVLEDASLIRASGITTEHSFEIAAHMNKETGPGRFALGPQFPLIKRFFDMNTVFQQAKSYSKDDLRSLWGLDQATYDLGIVYQYNWSDDYDDFIDRTYVFGHQTYQVSNGVSFVVTPQGDRYIVNFGITPQEENFDFITRGYLSQLGNDKILNANVDPSFLVQSGSSLSALKQGIGRKVRLIFTDPSLPRITYRQSDYDADSAKLSRSSVQGGLVSFAAKALFDLVPDLWNAGITRFITNEEKPRAILYGTQGDDTFDLAQIWSELHFNERLKSYFVSNGALLIGSTGLNRYQFSYISTSPDFQPINSFSRMVAGFPARIKDLNPENSRIFFEDESIEGKAEAITNWLAGSQMYTLRRQPGSQTYLIQPKNRYQRDARALSRDLSVSLAGESVLDEMVLQDYQSGDFGINLGMQLAVTKKKLALTPFKYLPAATCGTPFFNAAIDSNNKVTLLYPYGDPLSPGFLQNYFDLYTGAVLSQNGEVLSEIHRYYNSAYYTPPGTPYTQHALYTILFPKIFPIRDTVVISTMIPGAPVQYYPLTTGWMVQTPGSDPVNTFTKILGFPLDIKFFVYLPKTERILVTTQSSPNSFQLYDKTGRTDGNPVDFPFNGFVNMASTPEDNIVLFSYENGYRNVALMNLNGEITVPKTPLVVNGLSLFYVGSPLFQLKALQDGGLVFAFFRNYDDSNQYIPGGGATLARYDQNFNLIATSTVSIPNNQSFALANYADRSNGDVFFIFGTRSNELYGRLYSRLLEPLTDFLFLGYKASSLYGLTIPVTLSSNDQLNVYWQTDSTPCGIDSAMIDLSIQNSTQTSNLLPLPTELNPVLENGNGVTFMTPGRVPTIFALERALQAQVIITEIRKNQTSGHWIDHLNLVNLGLTQNPFPSEVLSRASVDNGTLVNSTTVPVQRYSFLGQGYNISLTVYNSDPLTANVVVVPQSPLNPFNPQNPVVSSANSLSLTWYLRALMAGTSLIRNQFSKKMQTPWECQEINSKELICVDTNQEKHGLFVSRESQEIPWSEAVLVSQEGECEVMDDGFSRITHCKNEVAESLEYEATQPSLTESCSQSALTGAVFAAIPEAIGDYLNLSGRVSESTAEKIKLATNAVLVLTSGSWLAAGSSWLTAKMLTQLGCSQSQARVGGNVVGFAVNMGTAVTPTRVATALAYYAGSRFGLWAEKKVAQRYEGFRHESRAP